MQQPEVHHWPTLAEVTDAYNNQKAVNYDYSVDGLSEDLMSDFEFGNRDHGNSVYEFYHYGDYFWYCEHWIKGRRFYYTYFGQKRIKVRINGSEILPSTIMLNLITKYNKEHISDFLARMMPGKPAKYNREL